MHGGGRGRRRCNAGGKAVFLPQLIQHGAIILYIRPCPAAKLNGASLSPSACPANSLFGPPVRFFNGLPKPAQGGIKRDKPIHRNAIQRRHFCLSNIRHRSACFPF